MHAHESGLLVTFFQKLPSLTIIHARLNLQANLSETVSDCYMKQDALDAPGPVVDACPACFLTLPVLVYFSLYNPPSTPIPTLAPSRVVFTLYPMLYVRAVPVHIVDRNETAVFAMVHSIATQRHTRKRHLTVHVLSLILTLHTHARS